MRAAPRGRARARSVRACRSIARSCDDHGSWPMPGSASASVRARLRLGLGTGLPTSRPEPERERPPGSPAAARTSALSRPTRTIRRLPREGRPAGGGVELPAWLRLGRTTGGGPWTSSLSMGTSCSSSGSLTGLRRDSVRSYFKLHAARCSGRSLETSDRCAGAIRIESAAARVRGDSQGASGPPPPLRAACGRAAGCGDSAHPVRRTSPAVRVRARPNSPTCPGGRAA